jgi:hypothetical protein
VKSSLLIWLFVELVLAAGMSASVCILRRDERHAFHVWRDNPTTESRAALDAERAVTFRHHVVLVAVLFGGMAVVTVLVVRAVSRRRSLLNESHTPPKPLIRPLDTS